MTGEDGFSRETEDCASEDDVTLSQFIASLGLPPEAEFDFLDAMIDVVPDEFLDQIAAEHHDLIQEANN